MNDWPPDWKKIVESFDLERFNKDAEQFWDEVSQTVNNTVDTLTEATEVFLEQVEEAIAPPLNELDRELEGWLEPLWDLLGTLETSVMETTAPVSQTVEPMLNEHPMCVGCRHYHGQAYNGVMFVCGMHPYGWEGEKCPDWESTWKDTPRP